MFRRCMWNFLKMEIEHIKNVNTFKAVETLNLPIKKFQYNVNEFLLTFNDFNEDNTKEFNKSNLVFI